MKPVSLLIPLLTLASVSGLWPQTSVTQKTEELREMRIEATGKEKGVLTARREGQLLEMSGRYEEAQKAYQAAAFGLPGKVDTDSLLNSARMFYIMGQNRKAELQLKTLSAVSSSGVLQIRALALRFSFTDPPLSQDLLTQIDRLNPLKEGEGPLVYAALRNSGLKKDDQERWIRKMKLQTLEADILERKIATGPGSPQMWLFPTFLASPSNSDEPEGEVNPSGTVTIQIGSFSDPENAAELVKTLKAKGHKARVLTLAVNDKQKIFKVIIPDIPEEQLGRKFVILKELGYEGYVLK